MTYHVRMPYYVARRRVGDAWHYLQRGKVWGPVLSHARWFYARDVGLVRRGLTRDAEVVTLDVARAGELQGTSPE